MDENQIRAQIVYGCGFEYCQHKAAVKLGRLFAMVLDTNVPDSEREPRWVNGESI